MLWERVWERVWKEKGGYSVSKNMLYVQGCLRIGVEGCQLASYLFSSTSYLFSSTSYLFFLAFPYFLIIKEPVTYSPLSVFSSYNCPF